MNFNAPPKKQPEIPRAMSTANAYHLFPHMCHVCATHQPRERKFRRMHICLNLCLRGTRSYFFGVGGSSGNVDAVRCTLAQIFYSTHNDFVITKAPEYKCSRNSMRLSVWLSSYLSLNDRPSMCKLQQLFERDVSQRLLTKTNPLLSIRGGHRMRPSLKCEVNRVVRVSSEARYIAQ
jgi:hypothetical protein